MTKKAKIISFLILAIFLILGYINSKKAGFGINRTEKVEVQK